MSEQEIFNYLFAIFNRSDDKKGVVASCLVRDGKIIADAVSMHEGIHAEYALLQNCKRENINFKQTDIVYTTVEPCGKRTPGGPGEAMGDCTTNLIKAGIKRVVYAAPDPDASDSSRHKFIEADVDLASVSDREIIKKAIALFNATQSDVHGFLPGA